MKRAMTGKAKARREEILRAAVACFREKGLSATTTIDIRARLAISAGHLYYYFKSKEQLVEEIVVLSQRFVLTAAEALIERDDALDILMGTDNRTLSADPPPLALDNATLLELYAEATRNPRLAKLVRTYWVATQASVRAVLTRARRKGRIRNQADQERAMILLVSFMTARPLAAIADPSYDASAYSATIKRHLAPLIDMRTSKTSMTRKRPSKVDEPQGGLRSNDR